MPRPIDPSRPTSTRRAGRVRMLLAGVIASVLAVAGVAYAAPAAAAEPSPVPDLEVVSVIGCDYFSTGEVTFAVSGLDPAREYAVTLSPADIAGVGKWVFGGVAEAEQTSKVGPGDYDLVLTEQLSESESVVIEETSFTIRPCVDIGLEATWGSCSVTDEGSVAVQFSGLIQGRTYSFNLYDQAGYEFFEQFTASGAGEERAYGGLPPGNFVAFVGWSAPAGEPSPGPVYQWAGVAVEPCQPVLEVEITECPASGGVGSALLTLSSLLADVEYEVRVTGDDSTGSADGDRTSTVVADASGNAQVKVDGLPAGASFTAWVDGVWVAPPWEEPSAQGGNYEPMKSVDLAARADVTLEPCPATTVTPATPAAPAAPAAPAEAGVLPATGADDAGGLLLGAMLLFGLGGAALVTARRGRVPARGRR